MEEKKKEVTYYEVYRNATVEATTKSGLYTLESLGIAPNYDVKTFLESTRDYINSGSESRRIFEETGKIETTYHLGHWVRQLMLIFGMIADRYLKVRAFIKAGLARSDENPGEDIFPLKDMIIIKACIDAVCDYPKPIYDIIELEGGTTTDDRRVKLYEAIYRDLQRVKKGLEEWFVNISTIDIRDEDGNILEMEPKRISHDSPLSSFNHERGWIGVFLERYDLTIRGMMYYFMQRPKKGGNDGEETK